MNEFKVTDKVRVPESVTGKPATGVIVSLSKGRYHISVTIDGSDVVTTLLQRTQEELNTEGFVKL